MGKQMNKIQMKETRMWIDSLNPKNSHNGTLVGSFDPVLILLAHLSKFKLIHLYNGTKIEYTPDNYVGEMTFKSNKSHFWS